MPDLDSLSPDQRLALKTAAKVSRPSSPERSRSRRSSCSSRPDYDQFADRAKFTKFLPLMAERFARQRLFALARSRGSTRTMACRSCCSCACTTRGVTDGTRVVQPPGRGQAIAWSGGSEPSTEINPSAIEAMREVGINIAMEFPKPWTDEILRAADVVITMGCGDACPIFPGKRYEDWELDDPEGLDVDSVRPIRDEIGRRVQELLTSLQVPVA